MKIGMNTDGVGHLSLDQTLDLAAELGLDYVEFATGNWSSAPHLGLDAMLTDPGARRDLQAKLAERGLRISALTCSGNPLHPGPSGREHDAVTRATIELAGLLGVERVVLMSGLPAGPGDSHPNWVTVSWPPETGELLEWQWTSVVIPYWRALVPFANRHGLAKLCLEMHPQQVVYNVPTLHRLREAVGPTVGANFDPSHLMWMGADPLVIAAALGDAIYHVHAKDARIEPNAATRTVLETMPLFTDTPGERAWNYVTLGDGHDESFWRRFCAALAEADYDDVLSIEHEDTTIDPVDGVRRTVDLLRRVNPLTVT
jgi:sugar phosphate isomerase/epimerase